MMKSEPKPFASLSSGLLARKGAARPAMRPQGFGQLGSGLDDLGWNDMGYEPPKAVLTPVDHDADAIKERVNPVSGLTPVSPVHAAQDEIVQRLGGEADDVVEEAAAPAAPEAAPAGEVVPMPVRKPVVSDEAPVASARPKAAPRPRSVAGAKGKAAFTLRLDHERHLKLRLACVVSGTSAQQLVTKALDALLDSMPELDAMAERAPERSVRKG